MKKELTAGVFILLMAIGTTYFIVEGDTAYYCEDTELVGLCWKLSNINADGLQTRCYYNESTPTRYKNCKTGWIEYEQTEFTGNSINNTEIGFDLDIPVDKKEILNSIGINEPIISPCIRMNEFNCKSNVYEKGGINKDIEIIIKYCEEYEINYSNGECLSWEDENKTICLEYEILNETTNNCIDWKTLTQLEIENEMKKEVEELLKSIADVQASRNEKNLAWINGELIEILTGKIMVNLK